MIAMVVLMGLSACGVDGAPVRPGLNIGVGLDGSVRVKPSVKVGPVKVSTN